MHFGVVNAQSVDFDMGKEAVTLMQNTDQFTKKEKKGW